jgi:hypothetical protein
MTFLPPHQTAQIEVRVGGTVIFFSKMDTFRQSAQADESCECFIGADEKCVIFIENFRWPEADGS